LYYLIFETNTSVLSLISALSYRVFPARNPPLVGVLTVPRTIYQIVGDNINHRGTRFFLDATLAAPINKLSSALAGAATIV
jgi:hypothetical protein